MQWDESCAWERSRKACHFEKSLPRYVGYNDFPPTTLLRNEENNRTSPSSHDGAVTAPASLPVSHKGLRAFGVSPKNSRIQRAITALRRLDTNYGWSHPEITLPLPQVAPSLTHPPTLPQLRERNRFSQNMQCDLYNRHHQVPPIYLCSHGNNFWKSIRCWALVNANSSCECPCDYWVILSVQKSNLVQVWSPASVSSLVDRFFVTTRFFFHYQFSIPRKRYAQIVINSPDPCLPTTKYTELPPNPFNTFF